MQHNHTFTYQPPPPPPLLTTQRVASNTNTLTPDQQHLLQQEQQQQQQLNQQNIAQEQLQYPLIQFYKGSLVRLASGQLKHVEDLNSDDFIESAKQVDVQVDSGVVKDFLDVDNHTNNSSNNKNNNPQTNILPKQTNSTVLIKFYLESSQNIVFIEVPVEHPFFVFHRGWSSWDPQKTLDKFNLKCRKLKIGDTCISLIRRMTNNQTPHQQQQAAPQSPLLETTLQQCYI